MNSLNSILIEGNLVRDPEVNQTPKGTMVCKFSIASNRFYKLDDGFEQEVSFFDVTAWSQTAKLCSENLKKGRGVRVIGRLKQDRWKDNDGKGKSKVYIIADQVAFKPVFNNKVENKNKLEVASSF